MGGGDKGLQDLGGSTMLKHVLSRFARQVGPLVLNANGDPVRFRDFGLPVVADPVAGFAGPLAGILAWMRWVRTNAPEVRHMASVSTDAPFLPLDLVSRFAAAVSADGRPDVIAIARSGGELHPVIGLWPVHLADDLDAELQGGVRKVLRWTDRHGTLPVDFEPVDIGGERIDPFFNANTPEDLVLARRLLAAPPASDAG
jgi:molybdopterin-guanine dinucleotide biosynthesis protein A